MPVIILKFKDKTIKEYPIIIGESLTIGRKEANDIVIDNLAVSGFHAQIDSVSSNFVLRDLESTNGTFVNNEKKDMHNLRHNDVILIGKHELLFDSSDLKKMKSGPADQFSDDKTRILETDKYRKMAGKPKPEPKPKKASAVEPQEDNRSALSKFFGKIFG
ncbi:MAG: FHA domain-containing protein [Desulfocapsaceae bacterium]|nr:FHA domain-containing protein [Desulfocapsaceae bacterium]